MISWLAAFAIVGATIHTGDGPPLEDATLLVSGESVVALGPGVAVPEGVETIDGRGAVVTPGLVDVLSRLGVMEIELEPSTIEATLGQGADPVRAALRASDTFDARASTLPPARAAGITSALVVPSGGLVSGQSAWVDLRPGAPPRRDPVALHVRLGLGEGPGSRADSFLRLRELWADARLYRGNRGPYISRRLRDLAVSAADLEVLSRALGRERIVVFHAHRHADILALLRMIERQRLNARIAGGAEAWLAADELAAAGVGVILDPRLNLPYGFDTLRAREDGARILHERGVELAFSTFGDAHRPQRLRIAAGNAVAHGVPYDAALAAITRVPAQMFGSDAGVLRPGAPADLVVWNGDPLEPARWATHVFVRGRPVDLTTRQDLLTRRYAPRD